MLPLAKLDDLRARYAEIEELLCQPDVATDAKRYTALTKERADLTEIVETYRRYLEASRRLVEDREAINDPELRELALEEMPALEGELNALERTLNVLLLPKDLNDEKNVILEVRSGTGGEEAALFAADLFRMYTRYAERQGWRVEVLSSSDASAGGLKEMIALIVGDRVYSKLRFEGGVHRVQRVPTTEAQGRIHTSTATVAVLPEVDDGDNHVAIRPEDLRVDTFRASGAGGQHVNRTESAIRITHLPSGIVVQCQNERSQHKNRATAMKLLRSRLTEMEREARDQAVASERRTMVGTGDRAEKIRTYNFPQSRVTDHRLQITVHNLDAILEGNLEDLITPLRTHHQASLLSAEPH